jgi:hypothetical protein
MLHSQLTVGFLPAKTGHRLLLPRLHLSPRQHRPPPTAPPLPFSYIGKSFSEGQWEIFLARGDQTYAVRNQTVIEKTYRVDAITPPILSLTYLPLNKSQEINIGVSD